MTDSWYGWLKAGVVDWQLVLIIDSFYGRLTAGMDDWQLILMTDSWYGWLKGGINWKTETEKNLPVVEKNKRKENYVIRVHQ